VESECEDEAEGGCLIAVDSKEEHKIRPKNGRGTARWIMENALDRLSLPGVDGPGRGNSAEEKAHQSSSQIPADGPKVNSFDSSH
jgi:hypothetical protein